MRRVVSEQAMQELVSSGNFDAEWYLKEYPDVAMTGLTAEEHYLWIGRTLNRKGVPERRSLSALALTWCVMTTKHTIFVANMIAASLRRHGWFVDVVTEAPETFSHDYYIVLCAQMFERLPPPERRVCYQLEQSVSSRWFTPEYFSILENSLAVFDYSLENLEFLADKGIAYPHVFYMPIGALDYREASPSGEKVYDLLFYGDYKSSPRRRKLLDALNAEYRIKIVDEVFGSEMQSLIRQAKFVLNLHYYERALLEMPRIQESLSLGTPVISENSKDSKDYPYLEGAVSFFDEGSVEDMMTVVARAMCTSTNDGKVEGSVLSSQRNFEFMFDRFLLARDLLPISDVEVIELPDVFGSRMISVSLPETVARRRSFEAEQVKDCAIFDGMRRSPAWIGCGLSYKALCNQAICRNKEQLIIVEDDVVLNERFDSNLETVERYLSTLDGNWDIFSGVIASLHEDVEVLKVENFEGLDFVTVNKMTSMVFNIYNRWAMQLIANWSPINGHVETNAIDRYLENADLRVVVVHPYIAGHREEVHSTLWNFKNTQYVDMILESEVRLGRLKDAWLASNRRVHA